MAEMKLVTLTYQGEPRAEDIVDLGDEQYLRLSDKPCDLAQVYSVTTQVEGETIVSGKNEIFLDEMGFVQGIYAGDVGFVITLFADKVYDGVVIIPKGTYSFYSPDEASWVSNVDGAREIGGEVLAFDISKVEEDGWYKASKASDKHYDLSMVTEAVIISGGVSTVYNQFNIEELTVLPGVRILTAKTDNRHLLYVSENADLGVGTTFAYTNAGNDDDYYTARVEFAKEDSDGAEISVGKKFLLYRMFHPIIAMALCSNGQTVPDSVLVSADGYVLTDKNGLYLIPKEGGNDATPVQIIVTGDEAFSFSSANKAVYFMNEDVALKNREQIVNATCTHFTYGAGNVLAEMNDGEFIFNITAADGLTTGNVSFKNSKVFTSKANAAAWFKEQLANGTPVTITCYIKEVE